MVAAAVPQPVGVQQPAVQQPAPTAQHAPVGLRISAQKRLIAFRGKLLENVSENVRPCLGNFYANMFK